MTKSACMGALLAALLALPLVAADPVVWVANDVSGKPIKIPAGPGPAVVLFIQDEQEQSRKAVEELKAVLARVRDVQVVAIVSGKDAEARAKKLAGAKFPWPIVADADYAISGRHMVHVWPTTVVLRPDGREAAHLAGVSRSYERDLDAHLAHAAGKIDDATLKQRLESQQNVVDSQQQAADRHLRVARRLLEKGLADQAKVELAAGLKLEPENAALQLAMIEVLLATREAPAALELLDGLKAGAAPAWRLRLLRGRAMIAMEKWDEARAMLLQAVQLNPDPAEAYYELGRVYQHQGDWQRAAEAFRRAFESTPVGRKLGESTPTPAKP